MKIGQQQLDQIDLQDIKKDGQNYAIYEYDVQPDTAQLITNPIKNFEGYCKINCWVVFLVANATIIITFTVIGICIGYTVGKGGAGASCKVDSDCDASGGFLCVAGLCSCLATQYPTTIKCINKKGYGETCTGEVECNEFVGLNCTSSKCDCDTAYRYYNGSECVLYSTYNEPCVTTQTSCNPKYSLYCDSTTKRCACDTSKYFWDVAYGCINYKVGGEMCSSNSSCKPGVGLYCALQGLSAGSCSCNTNYVWNSVTCTTLKNYGQSCVISNECYTNLNMICNSSSLCGCPANYYYNGTICVLKSTNMATCSANMTCDDTVLLYCNGVNCICSSLHFWDNNSMACLPRKFVGGTCSSVSICDPNSNLLCAATGASMGSCACPSTTFWNGTYCVTKYGPNITCDSSLQCNELQGLICNNATTLTNKTICDCVNTQYFNGAICVDKKNNATACTITYECKDYCDLYCNSTLNMCLCPDTHYWNGSCCVYKRVYTVPCVYDYQCDDKRNLICPTTVGACICPFPSVGYTCDCPLTHYWDSTLIMCVPRKSWMGVCITGKDYMCQTSGTGLSCISGVCDCPGTALGWFWNGNMCKKCPSGWTLFGNSYCYFAVPFILDQPGCNDFCSVYTATLLVISNQTEYDFFQSIGDQLLPILGNESFIGLSYASGKWSWMTGAVLANNSAWWCAGHPDPTGAKKCGAMLWKTTTSFCISSTLCYVYGSSICELY